MSPMIQKKSKNEGVLSYYDIHNNSQNHHNNQIIVDEILAPYIKEIIIDQDEI